MIRVAFIADTHADASSRWDEHCRIMDWIAEDLRSQRVDCVVHMGDVFDGQSTPTERTFIADWCRKIADQVPLCLVAGNHDKKLDIQWLSKLRAKHPIIATEEPGVWVVAGCAIAMLPWPRTANLLAAIGKPVAHEDSNRIAVEALRSILLGMRQQLAEHDGPRILAAHAMIEGSKTDSRQPLVGLDMSITTADLALAQAHFVGVGHVHAENDMSFGDVPIVIPGCPYHRNFGEPGPCSYVIASFEHFAGELTCPEGPGVRWHCEGYDRIPTPARPMLLLEAEWDGRALIGTHRFADVDGAECRLRYTCTSDQREAAAQNARESREIMLQNGAVMVKLEEILSVSTRARTPEITTAQTVGDKLKVVWKARDLRLGAEREARLLSKALELEGEV